MIDIHGLARTPHLLICCDYDGTLSPITDTPARAQPLSSSVTALRALSMLPATHPARDRLASGHGSPDQLLQGPLGLEVVELGRIDAATPDAADPAPAWVDLLRIAPARAVVIVAECPDHVDASALMRLRAGALAVAGVGLPPHAVLQRMDRFVDECQVGFPVSLAVAAVDAVAGSMRVACAGAPPPLFLMGEEISPATSEVGPPVGLGARYPEVREERLPDGAVIAFVTALGLAAGPDTAGPLREVTTLLAAHRDRRLADMAGDLALVTDRTRSRAPMMLLRRHGDPTLSAQWRLPATPRSAMQGRHLIDALMKQWPGSTALPCHDVRLVATELLTCVLATSPESIILSVALTEEGIRVETQGIHATEEGPASSAVVVAADAGRTVIADLSTRGGARWESAGRGMWAELPWPAPSGAPGPSARPMLDVLVGRGRSLRWTLTLWLVIPMVLIALVGETSGAVAILLLVGAVITLAVAWEILGLVREGGAYHIERCPTCRCAVDVAIRGSAIDPLRVASRLVEHCTREHGVERGGAI